jgi:pimeloyl-ACP methyl ester carboxylesterase
MAAFVLIPGAGGSAYYWQLVVPLLEAAGHTAIAVDLPGDDERAGLREYAEIVLAAIASTDEANVILVAQSLGGFTAGTVCGRAAERVGKLVFVNAMIPKPGEKAGDYWANTGTEQARVEAAKQQGYSPTFDMKTYFLHDVPEKVAREGESKARPEAKTAFAQPCVFERWPDVPIHVLVGRDDRFMPSDFQKRVASERLAKPVTELAGGHLVALANPRGVADTLLAFARPKTDP